MALCKKCGRQLENGEAKRCPSCQRKVSGMRKKVGTIVVTLLAVIVFKKLPR